MFDKLWDVFDQLTAYLLIAGPIGFIYWFAWPMVQPYTYPYIYQALIVVFLTTALFAIWGVMSCVHAEVFRHELYYQSEDFKSTANEIATRRVIDLITTILHLLLFSVSVFLISHFSDKF